LTCGSKIKAELSIDSNDFKIASNKINPISKLHSIEPNAHNKYIIFNIYIGGKVVHYSFLSEKL